jgi:hypothetical protein
VPEELPSVMVQATALREAIVTGVLAGLAGYDPKDPQAWRRTHPRALAEYLSLHVAPEVAAVADAFTARVMQDAEKSWEAGADAARGFVPPF